MNLFYRIFLFQLLSYIVFFVLSVTVQEFQRAHNIPQNSQWIFNVATPIETWFLTWAAYVYFKTNRIRIFILVGYAIYLIGFIGELSYTGFRILSIHGYIVESILVIILYILILNKYFREQNGTWKNSPLFWISLGIVIYFGGIMPYLSLMNYLQVGHQKLNGILYYVIINIFANLRYILLGVGFWLVHRNAVKKISLSNE